MSACLNAYSSISFKLFAPLSSLISEAENASFPIYVVSFVFKIDILEPLKAPSSILVTFFKSIGFSSLKHFASSNALALIVVIFSPKFKFNDSSQELKFLSPR